MTTNRDDDQPPEQLADEHLVLFLEQLEQRRGGHATAMWQAPGLTVASQAFLLVVLADGSIPRHARNWVLAAGIATLAVTTWALLRLGRRERQYSEEIARYSRGVIPDVRLLDPKRARFKSGLGPVLWTIVFVLFAIADYVVTTSVPTS